jgi:hypothetical protein
MKLHKVILVFLMAGAVGSQIPLAAQQGYDRYGDPDARYFDDRAPAGEVGFFYEELSPYGDWIYSHEYGWAWLPRNVGIGWRPYIYGRWVPCDLGWYWVSDEPFGWATYHYGRWALDPRYGWIWTPGRIWGPAWVAWQFGQGYVGWAPLPPEVGFELGIGLRLGGLDLNVLVRPHHYTFVEERVFLAPRLDRYAEPSSRNVTIIQRTTNVTQYISRENRVINRGPGFDRVERAVGQRVKPWRIAQTERRKGESVSGSEVTIYRPPRQRLDSVKVDDSKPRRSRAPQRTDRGAVAKPPDLRVAPRVKPAPPQTRVFVQRRQEEDKKNLESFERAERQRLEKIQQAEREKRVRQAEATAIAQRHKAEKKALEEQLQRTRQQLATRREVERRAEKVTPPGKPKAEEKKATDKKPTEKKGKSKPRPSNKPPR